MPPLEPRLLYLVRHGQTEWNLARRLQGGRDSPLTARGRDQAVAAAEVLSQAAPAKLLASTLGRAKATAEIIAAELGIPLAFDWRLGEISFGECEGLTREEIEARNPGLHARREQDKWNFRWAGGESCADAARRVSAFIDETLAGELAAAGTGPIAVIGHETVNMILLGRLIGLEPRVTTGIGQPNNIVYRLEGRRVDHRRTDPPPFAWQPGLLQKHSPEILTLPAA